MDGNLKRQLEEDTLHTCDLHFHHDEYEISKQFLFNLVPELVSCELKREMTPFARGIE